LEKVHIKKGDTVYVLSGKDKGKKGKVIKVLPRKKKAIVEGVNMATKHQKTQTRYRSRRHSARRDAHLHLQVDGSLREVQQAYPDRP